MRDAYHDEIDQIGQQVLQMRNCVAVAMDRATQALLDADLSLAQQVMAEDHHIDSLRLELENRAVQLIAQQQPVATDLRVLISTIHLAADLERMGDLAGHVAKIALLRYPDLAVPPPADDVIAQMGEVARSLGNKVAVSIGTRDVALAQAVEEEDDSMDALRRKLFVVVLSSNWSHGTEAAIDTTLLGRYYERYADHAVAVAKETVYVVTGQRN